LGTPHGALITPTAPRRDPHSFGRPDEIAVDHLSLDLAVDFDARQLNGSATLRLARNVRHEEATALWLDARDLLYTELAKTPEGLAQGRRIYETARPKYHSISQGTMDGILRVEGKGTDPWGSRRWPPHGGPFCYPRSGAFTLAPQVARMVL
jgi:aminopeptidase N